MPKYRDLIYGDGHTYGFSSRVLWSAEPVKATALSHSKIEVTWAKPTASAGESYVGFRIVRNQEAFPETEEDGTVLYEFYSRSGETMPLSAFTDGEDTPAAEFPAPLVSGRFAYYRAWILLDASGEWVRAGDAYTLLPSPHLSGTSADTAYTVNENGSLTDENLGSQQLTSTHDRFLNHIPRTLLSKGVGPLDEIEEYVSSANVADPISDVHGNVNNSLLNTFLAGFSLTLDEMLNFAEFISPELSGKNTEPNILELQSHQLNLSFDTSGVTRAQKRLVREALYTYRRKGTLNGLQTIVESLTGYDAVITESHNLMLSPQDSTFYKGTGFWVAGPDCTLTANGFTIATPTTDDEPEAIDIEWCGRIDPFPSSTNTSISLGTTAPITRGIPVTAGTAYNLSFYAYSNAVSGAAVTPTVYWYDANGTLISTNTMGATPLTPEGTPFSLTTDWVKYTFADQLAPAKAVYLGLSLRFGTDDIYYLDMMQVAVATGPETPAFKEARGVSIFLTPTKTNYILDPSFENDGYGFTFNGTAGHTIVPVTVGGVYEGPVGARPSLWKLKSSLDAGKTFGFYSSNSVPKGKFYSYSVYAKASAEISGQIYFDPTNYVDVTLSTDWKRYSFTLYVPDDGGAIAESTVVPGVFFTNSSSGTIDVEFDCVQLEAQYYPTDYFDGSLTLSGAAWAGTVAESVSYYYPNRYNKLVRLANEIENYIPLNTPYKVDMYMNEGATLPPKGIS